MEINVGAGPDKSPKMAMFYCDQARQSRMNENAACGGNGMPPSKEKAAERSAKFCTR